MRFLVEYVADPSAWGPYTEEAEAERLSSLWEEHFARISGEECSFTPADEFRVYQDSPTGWERVDSADEQWFAEVSSEAAVKALEQFAAEAPAKITTWERYPNARRRGVWVGGSDAPEFTKGVARKLLSALPPAERRGAKLREIDGVWGVSYDLDSCTRIWLREIVTD